MSFIANFIQRQIQSTNFSHPLAYLDLIVFICLLTAFLLYMRRFPVFRVFLGVIFLLICAQVFTLIGLTLTAMVFSWASLLILISFPLIFAPEIRHYLEKLGRFSFLRLLPVLKKQRDKEYIHNLVGAVFELAERKIGALIIIERRTRLGHLLESGILLDAHFGAKLLASIFFPNSPLHDGAVLLVQERIMAARCTVSANEQVKLDPPFGMRHKAGLSITKETDAISIIVSEQRGEVTLAENGKFILNLSQAALTEKLFQLL